MAIAIMIFIVLLVLVAESTAGHVSCVPDYGKIGCYNGDKRLLTTELVNDRDMSSGIMINWRDFGAYIHSLACRCSEKAKAKGFRFFGIHFYGVCYGGNDISAVNEHLAGNTGENNCINGNYAKCLQNDIECAGNQDGEFIYEITEVTKYATCTFVKGDGKGGPEINIGYKETVAQCINDCIAKKATYPDINGVTIPPTGRVNCYCERRMTGSNGSGSWKTCKLDTLRVVEIA